MSDPSKKLGPRVTTSVTADDHNALAKIAKHEDRPISWVVRRAIEGYLRTRKSEGRKASPRARSKNEHT